MTNVENSLTTLRDFLALTEGRVSLIAAFFVALPALVPVIGFLHPKSRGSSSPWKYFYAFLVYLVCIPGMFASVLTGYTLFFTSQNLLDVNAVVYFLPIASMAASLLIMRTQVKFSDIPGFDRIAGLMIMLAASFAIVFALSRTRIWLVFGGSITGFFGIAAIVFVLLQLGMDKAFPRKNA